MGEASAAVFLPQVYLTFAQQRSTHLPSKFPKTLDKWLTRARTILKWSSLSALSGLNPLTGKLVRFRDHTRPDWRCRATSWSVRYSSLPAAKSKRIESGEDIVWTGGCLCGEVWYRTSADLEWGGYLGTAKESLSRSFRVRAEEPEVCLSQ